MTVRLKDANIEALFRPGGKVYRAVDRVTRRTANGAKRRAPVDTGQLRASILHGTIREPGQIRGRVWSPLKHAIYQTHGTGIYGPKRRRITPKTASVLVFKPKNNVGPMPKGKRRRRGVVFAKSVRGTPPNTFLIDALRDASPWPVRERMLR